MVETREEKHADGRIITRDVETGRIIKNILPSEVAGDMSRGLSKGQKAGDIDTLIIEAGYDLETAPLALKKVCEQVVTGGARSIQAVVEWRKWSDKRAGIGVGTQPYKCTKCLREFLHKEIGNEGFQQLLDVMKIDDKSERIKEAPMAADE